MGKDNIMFIESQTNFILKALGDTIYKYIKDFTFVEYTEPFKVIKFTNSDFTLNLWIPVTINKGDKYTVYFSYMGFPKDCVEQGIIKEILDVLKSLKEVHQIVVSNQISQEYKDICLENDFKYINADYIWEKNES